MKQIRKMGDLLRSIKKSEVPNTIFLIYDLKEYQIFENSCSSRNAKNLLKNLSYYDSFDYSGLHIYTAVVNADDDARKALQRSERAIPEDA